MNKLLTYLSVFLLLSCLTACDDIFVENISDNTISMVAPAEDAELNNNNITLVWETLEGAENYHVILVSPSFKNIETYVCDSITEDYKLSIRLEAGTYEWSVQGRNSAYLSLKSARTFKIVNP